MTITEAKDMVAYKYFREKWATLADHERVRYMDEVIELYAGQLKVKNLAQPDVSGQLPPMFIRWCISKKIEVYSGDAIGITSMDEGGMFPVVSAERLFEIFMEETGGNFR